MRTHTPLRPRGCVPYSLKQQKVFNYCQYFNIETFQHSIGENLCIEINKTITSLNKMLCVSSQAQIDLWCAF